MRALLDLVAPVRCVVCGTPSDGELCEDCATRVQVVASPICERCGAPLPSPRRPCEDCADLDGFRRCRSLVVYAEPARRLTLDLKRRGRGPLARAVGGLLADLASAHGLADHEQVVTFVPAGGRAWLLGFDHGELIARGAARALGTRLVRLIVRVNDGPRQADVAFAERRSNVRGRFAARPANGHILLVDDVFTTGATAEACSLALLEAGATSVDVVTWARTLRRRPGRRQGSIAILHG